LSLTAAFTTDPEVSGEYRITFKLFGSKRVTHRIVAN